MSRWKGIIVHHSAGRDSDLLETDNIHRYHTLTRKWSDIGYHWLVEVVEGHVVAVMGRPSYRTGSHQKGKNGTHLGVCFVGNFNDAPPRNNMMHEGARLLAGLCVMNGLDASAISAHRDHKATDCPGKAFPFDRLVEMVEERL